MKYAVMSANADATYSFPLPLTAALWKDQGITPLAILVGDGWESDQPALTAKFLNYVGCRTVRLAVRGMYGVECWAKWSRMLACLIPNIEDGDYLITSDADMAVIDVAALMANMNDRKALHLFYANSYPFLPDVYPTCYIGATARIWKMIVKPPAEDLESACYAQLNRYGKVGTQRNPHIVYFSDEFVLGEMLRAWPDYPQAAQLMSREAAMPEFPARRIQRECEPVERPIDFHLPRPCWTVPAWEAIKRYCFPVLTPDRRRQMEEYRKAWIA